MADELHWDVTRHVRGVLAEVLVAEAIHQKDVDAVLHAPRHPGYDVESETLDLRVDAKVASFVDADTDGTGRVPSVEWDAGGRGVMVHESATHLGLTVLASDASVKLISGTDDVLEGKISVSGRVFLVPRVVVEEHARALWSASAGSAGRGRYRYISAEVLREHEFAFSGKSLGEMR
jgi:hypothetical protein